MRKQILKDLNPYVEQFVGHLASEHDKVIASQGNIDKQQAELVVNELNRVAEHKLLKKGLYAQEQKYKEYVKQLEEREKDLDRVISGYNSQQVALQRETKEVSVNLAETKSIKSMNALQLEKNRQVENNYKKKLDFLKEDDNRLDKRQKELNGKSIKLSAKEKMVNRKEYDNAQIKLTLDERAEMIKIEEKRQKIDRANMEVTSA